MPVDGTPNHIQQWTWPNLSDSPPRINIAMKGLQFVIGYLRNRAYGVRSFLPVTSNTQVVASDYSIWTDATAGNLVHTLPAANAPQIAGHIFVFGRIDATGNTVTVNTASSSDKYRNANSFTVAGQYTIVRVQSDGVNGWWPV